MSNPIETHAELDANLDRITKLDRLLSGSPANGRQRRELRQLIRIEAAAYRKSLAADRVADSNSMHTRASSPF